MNRILISIALALLSLSLIVGSARSPLADDSDTSSGMAVEASTQRGAEPAVPRRLAEAASITVLSSNLANGGTVGEWGFSALVEVDGRCVLFDAGRFPDTVVRNAEALNIDLGCISDVVLSHFHFDHTTGLMQILQRARETNPEAMQRIHVAQGFFLPRIWPGKPGEGNQMIAARSALESKGVTFLEYTEPTEIVPSVWLTGPIERRFPEKTYPKAVKVQIDGEWLDDFVPDSQGLVVVTAQGPIVLLGCGHSGSVNLLTHVRGKIHDQSIHALMGGMHLFAADDATLDWTSERLAELGLEHLMAGHCTGVEPLMRLRAGLGLDRSTAVLGAVGSRFVLGEGIYATEIAR